jgi:hypothetical protein
MGERCPHGPAPSSGDIVVVGYPKSGTTWVCRLLAEALGCPVAGFLDFDHDEIAIEGEDRQSDLRCLKSHHQLRQLRKLVDPSTRVVVVVRDPRDIAVSGADYFKPERIPHVREVMNRSRVGRSMYFRFARHILQSRRFRIDAMITILVKGSGRDSLWLDPSWADHVKPYLASSFCIVRYEDLLNRPEQECERVLSELGEAREAAAISAAVRYQSFQAAKARYAAAGDLSRERHLRRGRAGVWTTVLTWRQRRRLERTLSPLMLKFGYDVA